MIDTGVDPTIEDLVGRVSPLSTDVIVGRNAPQGTDRHGAYSAAIIAANFNGSGTVGVAYNSTILSIRAEVSECTDPDDDTCFKSSDLVNALNYAVNQGARIINMSLGGEGPLGSAFEAALLRAVNAGAVIIASSGNESGANPEWPARYALDPRFAGAIIAVGAHDSANVMADFSNKAGVAANVYISAPGKDVITACGGGSCWRVSGTSFSAPHVSGAIALLLQAFPNLTGRQAIEILLRTARDAGDPGTDIVYGRGLLDLAGAFAPVGTTSVPTATGARLVPTSEPGSFIGSAFGDAFRVQTALNTIAHDEYDRLFQVNLGGAYPAAPSRSHQPSAEAPMRQVATEVAGPGGVKLQLTASQPVDLPEAVIPRRGLNEAPWLGDEPKREAMFGVQAGRLSFAAWQGQGGANAPFRTGAGDGFAALAQADQAFQGVVDLGHGLAFVAEAGGGDRRALLRTVERDASSYGRASLGWRSVDGGVALSLGGLDEDLAPLGGYMPSRSDLALPSQTVFYGLSGDWRVGRNARFSAEISQGETQVQGRFLSSEGDLISRSWRMAFAADCPAWLSGGQIGCTRFTASIAQPLRLERGTLGALLADAPVDYFDVPTFSRRSFNASPTGRQIDFVLAAERPLGDGAWLTIQALASREPRHVAGADPEFALIGAWRRGF